MITHYSRLFEQLKPDFVHIHIFDRFYRAVATRALPGSGLGLAIVKQFADDHDAVVNAVDTPGGGATISIEFSE